MRASLTVIFHPKKDWSENHPAMYLFVQTIQIYSENLFSILNQEKGGTKKWRNLRSQGRTRVCWVLRRMIEDHFIYVLFLKGNIHSIWTIFIFRWLYLLDWLAEKINWKSKQRKWKWQKNHNRTITWPDGFEGHQCS